MKKVLLHFFLLFSAVAVWAQPDATSKPGVVSDAVSFRADNAPAYTRGKVHLPGKEGQITIGTGKVMAEETDGLGQTHYRTQQTINGILVEGAVFIEHVTGGKVIFSNGVWVKDLPAGLAASASLPKEAALQKALQKTGAAKFIWQDAQSEAMLKQETGNPQSTFYPTGELVYYSSEEAVDPATLRLAYKFDIYAVEPLKREYVFIDAANGTVLGVRSRIHTTNETATAVTGFSGNQVITTDKIPAGTYRLRETGRGNGIATYNLNHGTNVGNATDFTNSTTTWNNANANKDQYATDAHWGAEKTYDFYKIKHNRNSIDNAGMALNSYVHYSTNYFNAFWDGQRMTYGDGNSNYGNKPLTALDVCGHEITHGLTEKTSNLNYSGESGGLNEGFSDIFGTAVENYARPAQWDWLIGGDFYTIRSMSNPNAYQQPDTYGGTYWSSYADVHISSGVLNYWFYLLSAGGTGTNDKGCAFEVTGIGIEKAAAIAFRTNTVYLTSTSRYADAAKFSLKAARDLYGQFSNEAAQTGAAWAAVNVLVAPVAPTISPVTTACSGQNTTLSLATGELNTSAQWKWYTGSCGGTLVGFGPSITVRPTVATTYYVRAEGGCTTTASACASITVTPNAAPPTPVVTASGPLSFCPGGNVTLSAPAGYTYLWSSGATTRTVLVTGTGSYRVTITNSSGCSATSAFTATTLKPAPPTPVVTASGPLSFCQGDGVTLSAPTGYTYLWSSGATTRTVLVTGTGSYRVTITNTSGCSATSAFTSTTVNPRPAAPTITASGPLTFNQGGSVTLSVPAGYAHYEWSNGTIGSNARSITVTTSGYYVCNVYNANNCNAASNTVRVIVNPLPDQPEITASGPLSFCSGDSVTLTAPAGYAAYTWSNGATTQSITVTNNGSYNVVVTNANGGSSPASDDAIVNVKPVPAKPVITLDGPATFCAGDDVTLSGPAGFAAYQWSNGFTSPSITTTATNTFSLTVTNAGGCTSVASDPVQITVNETPAKPVITAGSATTFCSGGSVTLGAPTGFATYEWNTGATTPSIIVTQSDTISVKVTNAAGCTSLTSEPVQVTVNETPEKPEITIGGSTAICEGSSVTLAAPAGYDSYAWSNGATTQAINVNATGNYSVVVKTATGCSSPVSDAVIITVNPLPAAPVIPNVTAYQGTSNVVLTAANCTGTLVWINPNGTSGSGNQIDVPTTATGTYMYQVACQSALCTSLFTTVTVTVVAPIISVSHKDGDNNQPANNTIKPYLQLNNESSTAVPYKELSIRYWLTAENYTPFTNMSVYYAQLGTSNVMMKYVKTTARQGAFGYVEYTFNAAAGNLPGNANSGPIQSGVGKQDWSMFNEADDYSFAPNTGFVKTGKITVYRNGSLIWGTEPTVVAPVISMAAYSQNQNNNTNTNTIKNYLKVNNEGNQPVAYKDITVRYWFTADGNSPLKYNLDYAQLGNSNVTGSFVTLPSPVDKADTYLQLSFPNLTDSLYPISSTGNIQQRINKQDWSAFNETNDHSFKIAGPMALNNLVTIYIKDELVFGTEPVIHSISKPKDAPIAFVEPFNVKVLQNPLEGSELQFVITGAAGKSLKMQLVDGSGKLLTERQIKNAGATEFQRLQVPDNAAQIIYLRVSTPDAFKVIKVMKGYPYH